MEEPNAHEGDQPQVTSKHLLDTLGDCQNNNGENIDQLLEMVKLYAEQDSKEITYIFGHIIPQILAIENLAPGEKLFELIDDLLGLHPANPIPHTQGNSPKYNLLPQYVIPPMIRNSIFAENNADKIVELANRCLEDGQEKAVEDIAFHTIPAMVQNKDFFQNNQEKVFELFKKCLKQIPFKYEIQYSLISILDSPDFHNFSKRTFNLILDNLGSNSSVSNNYKFSDSFLTNTLPHMFENNEFLTKYSTQVFEIADKLKELGNFNYVTQYVIPLMFKNTDFFMAHAVRVQILVNECIDKAEYPVFANYVIPAMLRNSEFAETNSELIFDLSNKCLENGAISQVFSPILPAMLENDAFTKTKIEKINTLLERALEMESSYTNYISDIKRRVATYTLPAMIKNHDYAMKNSKIITNLIKEVKDTVIERLLSYTLPALFENEEFVKANKALISEVVVGIIENTTLQNRHMPLDFLPQAVHLLGIRAEILGSYMDFSLEDISLQKGVTLPAAINQVFSAMFHLQIEEIEGEDIFYQGDNNEKLIRILDKIKATILSHFDAKEDQNDLAWFHNLFNNEHKSTNLKALLNDERFFDEFKDIVLGELPKEFLEHLADKLPKFFNILSLFGLKLSSAFGFRDLHEIKNHIRKYTDEEQYETPTDFKPLHYGANKVYTAYSTNLEPDKLEQKVNQINEALNALGVNIPTLETGMISYNYLHKFLHDQIQENLAKNTNINSTKLDAVEEQIREIINSYKQEIKTSDKTVSISLKLQARLSFSTIFAGAIANACYTNIYIPQNIQVVNIVLNSRRIEGNFLLIQSKDAEGNDIVVIRALNPSLGLSDHINQNQLVQQVIDFTKLNYPNRTIALINNDYPGEASTNRPPTFQAIEELIDTDTPIEIEEGDHSNPHDTTFNGYKLNGKLYCPLNPIEVGSDIGLEL